MGADQLEHDIVYRAHPPPLEDFDFYSRGQFVPELTLAFADLRNNFLAANSATQHYRSSLFQEGIEFCYTAPRRFVNHAASFFQTGHDFRFMLSSTRYL